MGQHMLARLLFRGYKRLSIAVGRKKRLGLFVDLKPIEKMIGSEQRSSRLRGLCCANPFLSAELGSTLIAIFINIHVAS